MKTTQSLCLGILFGACSLFAADFSKTSLDDLKKMAGTIEPKDALDYRIEINKRIENMTIKEARDFKKELQRMRQANQGKMTKEELQQYREAVRTQMQQQIDKMTVKEAREKGLSQYINHGSKHTCMHNSHKKRQSGDHHSNKHDSH